MKIKQVLLITTAVMGMTGCSNNFNRYNYDTPSQVRLGDYRPEPEVPALKETSKEPPIQPKIVGVCPVFNPPKLPAPPPPPRAILDAAKKKADKETAELEARGLTDPKLYAAERDKINRLFDAIEKDYIIALSRHAYTVQRVNEQALTTYRMECDKWIKAQKYVNDSKEN